MKTDMQLRNDILEELERESSINAAEIGVAVNDGVITLAGYIDNYPEKWEAERVAQSVSGVRALADEIEVRLPDSNERTDVDIAQAAADALEGNTSVPHDHIKVMVKDSWVILRGEVQWPYQKISAEDTVHHLTGVKGISNEIAVA